MAISRVHCIFLLLVALGLAQAWAKSDAVPGTSLSALSLEELDDRLQVSRSPSALLVLFDPLTRRAAGMPHRPRPQPGQGGPTCRHDLVLRLAPLRHPLPREPCRQRPPGDAVYFRPPQFP